MDSDRARVLFTRVRLITQHFCCVNIDFVIESGRRYPKRKKSHVQEVSFSRFE